MPVDLQAVYLALRSPISVVWPEVAAHGIWEREQSQMIPWGKFVAPYSVAVLEDMPEVTDRGMDNLGFRCAIDLYYVAEVRGKASPLAGKLTALARYLFNNRVLNYGVVETVSRPTVGDQIPANVYFAAKGQTYRAGKFTATVLVMSD